MKTLKSLVGAFGAGALLLGAANVDSYCECAPGLGPCGNDPPTAIPSGCQNSTGAKGFLGPNGSRSLATDDLVLHASALPPGQTALLFMGGAGIRVPFGDGVLCTAPGAVGLFRFAPASTGPVGLLEVGPGLAAHVQAHFPPAAWLSAGETRHFQVWYRDPAGPCGSGTNLTNGVALTFAP